MGNGKPKYCKYQPITHQQRKEIMAIIELSRQLGYNVDKTRRLVYKAVRIKMPNSQYDAFFKISEN